MDHHTKHLAHDIVHNNTKAGSGGEIFFFSFLSTAEQVALIAMRLHRHPLYGKQSSNKNLCVYIIKI
jgi:hypothetical protein